MSELSETEPKLFDLLPGERTRARREGVRRDVHLVEQVDEQVAQGDVVRIIARDVPTMSEATTGQNDWKVTRVVLVGIPQVATKQHGRAIEQSPISLR